MSQIGRYEIISELGRGAMGVVYRARDSRIGREVAMKTIRLSDKFDENEAKQLRDRLFREAQSAGRLSHPGIVTIYDIDEEDGLAFITMELVDGRTLEELQKAKEVRDIGFVTNMLLRTAAALDYAHEREIIHRDIKPGNIMITNDGRVKITDFGIARVSSSTMTQTGVVMGTPSYMSPEQVRGETISGRSDQFSLAVVVYELLTGSKPFSGDGVTTVIFKIVSRDPTPPRELNPNLSESVANTILRALSKGSDDRYTSCTEFAEAFAAACDSTGSHIFAPIDPNETLLMPQPGISGDEATSLGVPRGEEKSGAVAAASPPPAQAFSPDDVTVVDVPAKAKESISGSMPATLEPPESSPEPEPAQARRPQAEARQTTASQEPALPPRTATRTDPEVDRGGSKAWLGIVAAVLLIVGAAGFYLVNNPSILGLGGASSGAAPTADSVDQSGVATGSGAGDTLQSAPADGVDTDTASTTPSNALSDSTTPGGAPTPPSSTSTTTSGAATAPAPSKTPTPPAKKDAAPELVAVSLHSSVPGVEVAVDSKPELSCVTPCSLEMPPGEHRAVARLAGYELKIESFTLGNEPLDINLVMRQQVSTVFISSDPAGAEILIDGKKVDSVTNTRVDVPLGYHLITVRKGAAGTAERNVLMREGELRQLRFKLAPGSPPRGQVAFKSTPPGAQIILNNDTQSGVTPRELRIAPGNYRVTFSLPGYRPVIKEFEINEEETLTVDGTLTSQN